IDKGTVQAKLNVIPIRRGCGSWECRCGTMHTVPFNVTGKTGSVRVEVLPGPRGLGLVAGEIPKQVLRLAGVRDCWTRTFGSTSTLTSSALTVFDALTRTYSEVTQGDWVNLLEEESKGLLFTVRLRGTASHNPDARKTMECRKLEWPS